MDTSAINSRCSDFVEEVDAITYQNYRSLADQGITEVVELESRNDYELAGVVLDGLDRLSQRHQDHSARYAGELALASLTQQD